MSSQTKNRPGGNALKLTQTVDLICIEHLNDLDPYIDDIIARFNANQRLTFAAIADPVGVLREIGYELSPAAEREARHLLPRLSREGRDRYLAWLRNLDQTPSTFKIKLIKKKRGSELLEKEDSPSSQTMAETFSNNGKATAGFDFLAQFSESFCEQMVKFHYTEFRLPRSAYSIAGKIYQFACHQYYEDVKATLGEADHEVHFGEPSLSFLAGKTDQVQLTSTFCTAGFGSKPITGSVTVNAKLAVKKGKQGHPEYIQLSFSNLANNDVSFSTGTQVVPATLKTMVLNAYKNFNSSKSSQIYTPITLTLVDGQWLASNKINVTPGEAKFAVLKPSGAGSLLLVVGFNRAENIGNGDLNSAINLIKSGGEMAFMQGANWLQEGWNAAFQKGLPVWFDLDSGKLDQNGNLKLESGVWCLRADGLTGNLKLIHEISGWFDDELTQNIYLDFSFDPADSSVEGHVTGDAAEGWDCLLKFFLVVGCAVFGAFVGGVAGLFVGGIWGAAGLGAAIGISIGVAGGLLCGMYAVGWFPVTFDTSGIPLNTKQTLSYTQTVPENTQVVTVTANNYKMSAEGILLSAAVAGPAATIGTPSVQVDGYIDGQCLTDPASWGAKSSTGSTGPNGQDAGSAGRSIGISIGTSTNGNTFDPSQLEGPIGYAVLHYKVISTYALLGKLSYLWKFNGTAISSSAQVTYQLPFSKEMLRFNEVVQLGTLELTVTDVFGQKATWSANLTAGQKKDLRSLTPIKVKQAGYIDPIERTSGIRRIIPEVVSQVAWMRAGDDVAVAEGQLLSYTEFDSLLSSENIALVLTIPKNNFYS